MRPKKDRNGRDAVISSCQQYRYALWRRWGDGPQVLFLMLNPSTATATDDDPTIRRCIGFARRWGFGALAVGNLFAVRSTDPKRIRQIADPVRKENDAWLKRLRRDSALCVAAWGNHGTFAGRAEVVRRLLGPLHALKLTKCGQPAHPLYIAGSTDPVDWK